jgi:streptomycin 6-kinase
MGAGDLPLPRDLVEAAGREGRTAWLATLPATVARLAAAWSLTVGTPFQPGGQTAWVAPGRDAAGADLVLKVAWPHPEALDEAAGLRAWAGRGAVRVARDEAGEGAIATLLERCRPGAQLAERPEPEQDVVVARLLRRLWILPSAGTRFTTLRAMCDRWADESEARAAAAPARLDPGLVREGLALFRSLPRSAEREVLLATDLHAGNVLSASREPWLAIDPKPHVGDPAYDPLQHMLNCPGRLATDPRGLVRRMADLAGVDAERLALWLFARCVQEAPEWPSLCDVARRVAPR